MNEFRGLLRELMALPPSRRDIFQWVQGRILAPQVPEREDN
jgi:hypothetical protein